MKMLLKCVLLLLLKEGLGSLVKYDYGIEYIYSLDSRMAMEGVQTFKAHGKVGHFVFTNV